MKSKCVIKHYSGMTIESRVEQVSQEHIDKLIDTLQAEVPSLIIIDEKRDIHIIKRDFLSNSIISFQKCEDLNSNDT